MPKKTILPSGEIIFASDNTPDINPESLFSNTTKPLEEGVKLSITLTGEITLEGVLVGFKLDHQLTKRIIVQFTTTNQKELVMFVCHLEPTKNICLSLDGQAYLTEQSYVPVYFEMPGVSDILELVLEEKN